MKKLTLICIFLILLTNTAMNAEEPFEKDTTSPENNSSISAESSIITYNGLFYRYFGSYSLSNGVSLSYAKLTDYLRLIPENKQYIRGAAVWDILYWVFWASFVGLSGGFTYCMVADNFNLTDRVAALAVSSCVAFALGFGAGEMTRLNVTRAVNNYNLTVMGIPVK